MKKNNAFRRAAALMAALSITVSLAAPVFADTYYIDNGDITVTKNADGSQTVEQNGTSNNDSDEIIITTTGAAITTLESDLEGPAAEDSDFGPVVEDNYQPAQPEDAEKPEGADQPESAEEAKSADQHESAEQAQPQQAAPAAAPAASTPKNDKGNGFWGNTITVINNFVDKALNLTLKDVKIDVSDTGDDFFEFDDTQRGKAALSVQGKGNVEIELDGNNELKSGKGRAGLEKNSTGTLTLKDDNKEAGSLMATGGMSGAGIGGGFQGNGENITITGGTVTATGGESGIAITGGGAGIGGGQEGSGNNITITGGTVNAAGGGNGAGIGGGNGGDNGNGGVGNNITITGGTVTATGGFNAAGIGGGINGNGENITIKGGTVNATGGEGGAGLGGGSNNGGGINGNGKNITITGGTVNATGGDVGAGIGGGANGNGNNITITGGTVNATGSEGGAGIGGGTGGGMGGSGNNITITGGTVNAAGGDYASGIGGGDNGNGDRITITGGVVNAAGGVTGAGIGGGREGGGSKVTVSGAAQVTTTAGKSDVLYGLYGAGATIGSGGNRTPGGELVDGKEIQADISGLTPGYIHHILYNRDGTTIKREWWEPVRPVRPGESLDLHVETLKGAPLPFNTRQQGSTLRVTTDNLSARLHGTRQALETLQEQGVEQIQFVTTLKTTTLSVEDLLAEGGSWFALEHDGLGSRRLSAAQAESLKCWRH